MRLRQTTPANKALAATGVRFGACGNSRAATSSATSESTSGSSRPAAARLIFEIIDSLAVLLSTVIVGSFPLEGRKALEHHVGSLRLECAKTFISICRIDPQPPILFPFQAGVQRAVVIWRRASARVILAVGGKEWPPEVRASGASLWTRRSAPKATGVVARRRTPAHMSRPAAGADCCAGRSPAP